MLNEPTVLACRALARRVLAVAVSGSIGDWSAYIDAVPGAKHSDEMAQVARTGVKLDRKLAELIFPGLDIKKFRS